MDLLIMTLERNALMQTTYLFMLHIPSVCLKLELKCVLMSRSKFGTIAPGTKKKVFQSSLLLFVGGLSICMSQNHHVPMYRNKSRPDVNLKIEVF